MWNNLNEIVIHLGAQSNGEKHILRHWYLKREIIFGKKSDQKNSLMGSLNTPDYPVIRRSLVRDRRPFLRTLAGPALSFSAHTTYFAENPSRQIDSFILDSCRKSISQFIFFEIVTQCCYLSNEWNFTSNFDALISTSLFLLIWNFIRGWS